MDKNMNNQKKSEGHYSSVVKFFTLLGVASGFGLAGMIMNDPAFMAISVVLEFILLVWATIIVVQVFLSDEGDDKYEKDCKYKEGDEQEDKSIVNGTTSNAEPE